MLSLADQKIMSDKGMSDSKGTTDQKKEVIKNLYLSGIGEEFIAMQLDVEIPVVISVLEELGIYQPSIPYP
jgi:hypothetical protein